MRYILFVFALFSGLFLQAQSTSLFVNDNVDRLLWEDGYDINEQSRHTATRPFAHRPVFELDSSKTFLAHQSRKGRISPLFSSGLAGSHVDSLELSSQLIGGVTWNQDFGKRIQLDAALFGGITDGLPYDRISASSADVYPGIAEFNDRKGRTGTLWDLDFSLRFKASHIFNLEIGKAKHFWGEGYRSLFLSDNAAAYPYFKLKTKVWHIEYSNLFSWQQGKLDQAGATSFEDKFTSSHILSWNVSPRTSLQIFETIIWQSQDSLSSRGFDVYYLNPIIFYRPVEFAAGSADNAILGLGLNYKVYPSYLLYGQLVLDEFLLDQFLAGDGWWANKLGIQLGFKGFDAFGKEGLYMQAEVNVVRPFTYSHGSPVQNYAHLDQALAHPLGANFYEALLIGAYEFGDWELRNHASFVLKGNDELGRNLGGDIFRSYESPFRDLGNFVGQGSKSDIWANSIYLSKVLNRSSDTRLSLAYHFNYDMGDADLMRNTIGLSFRSNFGDGYR